MKPEQLRRWGLIGLVLLVALGLFSAFARYQQGRKRREPDVPKNW